MSGRITATLPLPLEARLLSCDIAEKSRVKELIDRLGAGVELVVAGDEAAVEADEAAVVALVELEVFVELLQAPATRPAPTKSAANARLLVTSGFSLDYGPPRSRPPGRGLRGTFCIRPSVDFRADNRFVDVNEALIF